MQNSVVKAISRGFPQDGAQLNEYISFLAEFNFFVRYTVVLSHDRRMNTLVPFTADLRR